MKPILQLLVTYHRRASPVNKMQISIQLWELLKLSRTGKDYECLNKNARKTNAKNNPYSIMFDHASFSQKYAAV